MNHLVHAKLKETVNLEDIIKIDELHYKSNCRKVYNFIEYSLPIVFYEIYLKDIYHCKMLMTSKAIMMLN